MAANNYFGFTAHSGTQYGYVKTAAPGAAYGGQTGYAVAPAAAATYGTQRAAATGYDTAYQAAATQGSYAAHAHAHVAAQHAAAQSAYDASKTAYYQQAAAAAAYPHPAPAAAQAPAAAYEAAAKTSYSTSTSFGQGAAARAAQPAKPNYANSYTAAATAAVAYPATQTYATPVAAVASTHAASAASSANTAKPLYSAATMYVAHQQAKGNSVGGWQGYKKGGGGGGFGGQLKAKAAPKVQQLHYCDVCKISCAGPQTYREHLEGQKHRKKEVSVKLAAAEKAAGAGSSSSGGSSSRAGISLRCELCDVTCTGNDAYGAHIRGIKHQKVVNLHNRLGKPIPSQEPKVVGGGVKKTIAGTPKINFVASGGLSTVAGTNADAGTNAEGVKTDGGEDENAAEEMETEPEIQPVGQDYIEEIKGDDGKVLSFNCKLCDCRFNDPNAKEMHMKGRRHRLQYKKKVQPDLVVDIKPSMRQRKLAEQKAQRMLIREEFWARRRLHECEMEEEERMFWEERRQYGSEDEWWHRGGHGTSGLPAGPMRGPSGVPMLPSLTSSSFSPHMNNMSMPFYGPPSVRRPESSDDRHVIAKHKDIYPTEQELQGIQRAVSHTERALKAVSDALVEQFVRQGKQQQQQKITQQKAAQVKSENKDTNANADKKDAKDADGKDAKEDGRDNQLFSFQQEGEGGNVTGSGGRSLKGVMRVGLLAKGLLLKGDRNVQLVMLCADRPTIPLLKKVAAELPAHLQKITDEVKYKVDLVPAEGAVLVSDGTVNVLVSLTSPVMRETNEVGGAGTATPAASVREDRDVLPRQKCLDALAALRHAKWFQARAAGLMSCVMIIRIMRDLCKRVPNWAPLNSWAMELLVEMVISSKGMPLTPGDALRRVFETVAGGLLLQHGPGLFDPCEKDAADALADMPAQKREDLTASAQQFLRMVAFRQIYKVLEMEALPALSKRSSSGWKFPRKRRRSNTETEVDGKMVKTEGEKSDTNESAAGTAAGK